MESLSRVPASSLTTYGLRPRTTAGQGSFQAAGAGITGGYEGTSETIRIIIAFFVGLALYNAIELIILVFVTFQRFRGLYFWSLVVSAAGIIPYSLGFLIKFFQFLNPDKDIGYVAVFFLSIGWYPMVTGMSMFSTEEFN